MQQVKTTFGHLAYQIDGDSDALPLVLCQRFRGTMDDWDPSFIAALAAERRVIRFDSAGIGRSEGEVPETIEGMAEVAIAFIRALGLEHVDLLGWSLGGIVAQSVALAAPDLVEHLIIAGSGPGGVSDGPTPHPKVPQVMANPVNTEEDFLFLFFAEEGPSREAGEAHLARLQTVEDRGPVTKKESVIRQLQAIGRWQGLRERLPELKMPILVANGHTDVMIPSYRSYVISQEAPDAKLIIYPNSGHGFLFQYVEDFSGEILRFLA